MCRSYFPTKKKETVSFFFQRFDVSLPGVSSTVPLFRQVAAQRVASATLAHRARAASDGAGLAGLAGDGETQPDLVDDFRWGDQKLPFLCIGDAKKTKGEIQLRNIYIYNIII